MRKMSSYLSQSDHAALLVLPSSKRSLQISSRRTSTDRGFDRQGWAGATGVAICLRNISSDIDGHPGFEKASSNTFPRARAFISSGESTMAV